MNRVLVLGGGQLGLMMAEAAARLGLVVDRYDPERALLLPGTSGAAQQQPAQHRQLWMLCVDAAGQ